MLVLTHKTGIVIPMLWLTITSCLRPIMFPGGSWIGASIFKTNLKYPAKRHSSDLVKSGVGSNSEYAYTSSLSISPSRLVACQILRLWGFLTFNVETLTPNLSSSLEIFRILLRTFLMHMCIAVVNIVHTYKLLSDWS